MSSVEKGKRRFGGRSHFYLHGKKKAEQETSVKESAKQGFHAGCLLGLFFNREDGGGMLHRNVG
jgi:hypothetical protein